MSRYSGKEKIKVDEDAYRSILESRGIKSAEIYESYELYYPTKEQMNSINFIYETWKSGDRYYKYAQTYYGDTSLWYVIAFINKRPTDTHVKDGETILIPTPVSEVLKYIHNR